MNKSKVIPKVISHLESAKEFASRAKWKDKLGDCRGAIENYRRAVELATHPQTAKEFATRADWKYNSDDRQGAAEDFTRALELETQPSELFELYFDRGFARAGANNHQGAIEDFNKALEIYQGGEIPPICLPYIYFQRASSRHALGDYQGAVDDYTISIDHQQPYPSINYFYRGKAKHELGDKEGACQDWHKALEALKNERDHAINQGYVKETERDGYKAACKRVCSAIKELCTLAIE